MVPRPLNPNTIRIFSWNVNGIAPFLKSDGSSPPSSQKITQFFTPSGELGKASHISRPSRTPTPPNLTTSPPPKYETNLRSFLHRHNWPALLLLQEVKIASTDTKTQDSVRAHINTPLPSERAGTPGPRYTVHFTLPTDPHNARGLHGSGKIYGVCSILRSDISSHSHVRSVPWDTEGRVSVIELSAPGLNLAVFNIYAVNGTANAHRDPATGAVLGTRHERKRVFQRLLRDECVEMQEKGWHVLVGGDMNVAPDARDGWPRLRVWPPEHVVSRKEFHDCFLDADEDEDDGKAKEERGAGFKGVDVWREMHKDERRYTYFSRGRTWGSSCDRVDYFVAGRGLWESGVVKRCGILDSPEERGPSDHVPIWVEIEVPLLGGEGEARGTDDV
jgi:exonuclease III